MTRLRALDARLFALGLRCFRYVMALRRTHPALRAATFSQRPIRGGSLPNVTFSDEGWTT